MAVSKASVVAFLCGLLLPGMGQFMLGYKKRGLCFFLPANILFVSALLVIAAKLFKAGQAIAPGGENRLLLIKNFLFAEGVGNILIILGGLYVALLVVAALDAFWVARKHKI